MERKSEVKGRKWFWRAVYIVTILAFFLPPYTSNKGAIAGPDLPKFLSEAFAHYSPPRWLGAIFQLSFIALVLLIWRFGPKIGRLVNGYFALLYVWLSLAPNIQRMEEYGVVVLISHLVTVGMVALLWMLDIFQAKNEWNLKGVSPWRYWVIPLAALAFFFPTGPSGAPSFRLEDLLYGYGIQYCPTTPVVLFLLTLIYPRVNRPLFVVLSITGVLYGLLNMMSLFLMPGYTLWLAVLHVPLLTVSLYGLILAFIAARSAGRGA